MRRWMNYETLFRTLKDLLREYLHEIGVRYELSGCYNGWHFEIYCNGQEECMINDFLDENTITEER